MKQRLKRLSLVIGILLIPFPCEFVAKNYLWNLGMSRNIPVMDSFTGVANYWMGGWVAAIVYFICALVSFLFLYSMYRVGKYVWDGTPL